MRNINFDRDPISSEDISSYKDFKSIQQKHAQTTNDLDKIKSGKSNAWYATRGGAIIALAIVGGFLFSDKLSDSNTEASTINEVVSPVVPETVKEALKWKVVFNAVNDPIHEHFDFDQLSSERIEYFQSSDASSIKSLIPNIKKSDLEYSKDKKVFRVDTDFSMQVDADKNVYKLEKGKWSRIDHEPFEFESLIKPRKMEPGKPGIRIDVVGFGAEYQEFANMIWQPMNSEDLDASFFDHNWPDGSIVETSVSGVYKITLVEGDIVKHFNGYPVLQKYAFKKAMKEYNKKLIEQQEMMKRAPKTFNVEKGIYTIE